MPPQYKQVFDRAAQKGGNAAAVAHHTLYAKDPEYRKLMQQMDEQQEQ
jgi:phosphoribosylcarboxyaminoimidazole (NCAIR) mutase